MIRATIFCVLLISCSDNLKVLKKDIEKYPEISPFVLSYNEFEGVHNIDLATLKFSYAISKSNKDLFVILDNVAYKNHWLIIEKRNEKRIYTKFIKSYPADQEIDTLMVSYNEKKHRAFFYWK